MAHEHGDIISHDDQHTAIIVARWLTVALPQDLSDALDQYASSLEPETTAAAAVRRVLHEALMGREQAHPPAM
jgi:hypothetical protein